MKVYFHINTETFANSYLIVNEDSKEALIIDPCKITKYLLNQIESEPYELKAILFTNTQPGKVHALSTLCKIYNPNIYAADFSVAKKHNVLAGTGVIEECGFQIIYTAIPRYRFDTVIYRLEYLLFTGDVLSASLIGETYSSHAWKSMVFNIKSRILTLNEQYTILPGSGPPTSVKAEKKFNATIQ